MFANLELELAVLHPQEEAGAAAEVQMGAALKSEKFWDTQCYRWTEYAK